jgi:hypothetical protein
MPLANLCRRSCAHDSAMDRARTGARLKSKMLNARKRIPEWRAVVRIYQEQRGPLPFWHLFKAILAGPVPRSVWRERLLKGCKNCPVFCREEQAMLDGRKCKLNACAGPYGSGCGCWCPTVALSANPGVNGCWGADNGDGSFGWPAYRFTSLWHRVKVTIGFFFGQ